MNDTKKSLFEQELLPAINFLSSKETFVDLKDLVISVIAEIIFFCNWMTDIYENSDKIALLIRKNCNNARQFKALKEYNRESLNILISTEWNIQGFEYCIPQTFANKHWAYDYEAEHNRVALTKFKEKKENYENNNKGKNYPIANIGFCGDKVYCITDSVVSKGVKTHENRATEIKKEKNNSSEHNETKNALLTIYNKLVEKRGGEETIKEFEYIWQWKISEDEFRDIKEELTSDKCKEHIKDIYESNVHCLFIVIAYIAESYKREWNGQDGEENELNEIGLEGKSQELAKAYIKDDTKIYISQSKSGRRNTRWLQTLRLEGGLPIFYIQSNRNTTNNAFVKFAEELYQDTGKAINTLAERSNSESIRHSYNRGYSLRKYVDTLLAEGLEGVCCTEDINKIFKEFKEIIEDGRQTARRNSKKFAYKYRIWNFQDEFLIHSSIVFKQDSSFNEPQELISRERLKQWGIKTLKANDIFWLKVNGKKYEFHPWGEEFYRSDIGLTEFPLPTVKMPNCSLMETPIHYIDKNGGDIKIDSIVKQDNKYIKFASDNGFDWMTGRNGELSAVLLRSNNVKFEAEHSEEILIVGDNLKWVEYSNRILINDKYVYSDALEVYPEDSVIHPITKNKFIRSITYYKNDERCKIFILDSSQVKAENFSIIGEDKKVKAKKVKYRNATTGYWEDYKVEETLNGFVNLGIDNLRLNAYILPVNATISRECSKKSGKIFITNIDGIIESEGYQLKRIQNGWVLEDEYKQENNYRDNIVVKIIIAEDEYILLEIIRPLKRNDKILERHIVSGSDRIPRKLEPRYQRRVFDDNGVSYHDDRCSQYNYSSKRIESSSDYCYIDKGASPEVEENVEFVFIPLDGEELKLTLSSTTVRERGQNIKYIYFDNLPKEQQGVIIQTLENKDKMPQKTYYEPKWIGTDIWEFTQHANPKTILKRLKLTLKHRLYFNVLTYYNESTEGRDEITPQVLVAFFADYCNECDKNEQPCDWDLLWNMAIELEKDWINIPRCQWKKFATDERNKQLVCDLFMNRPKSDDEIFVTFVKNYWNLIWDTRRGRSNDASKFLKAILDTEESDSNKWGYADSFPDITGKKDKEKKELWETHLAYLKSELERLIK